MAIKHIQTAHLVHDLKNPVSIIETSTRSLLDKMSSYGTLTARQEKVIKRMLRSALKIRTLADNMLELDQASLGVVNVGECTLSGVLRHAFMEVFDLVDPAVSDALDEATTLEAFRMVLRENDIVLEAEEQLLNRTIQMDETKLCLIVTNLLSNAFKFKDKSVRLQCMGDDTRISVSVKDDGPGIPEVHHQQIFDQYFQCVKVDGFPVRGHGLGLAGALALTEALGGTLSLCKGPQGAEFVVSFDISRGT